MKTRGKRHLSQRMGETISSLSQSHMPAYRASWRQAQHENWTVYALQLSEDTISSVGEKAKKDGSKGEGTRLSCSRAAIQACKMPKAEGCWLWQGVLSGGAKQPLPTCRSSAPSAHSVQKSCLGLTPKLTNYMTKTRTNNSSRGTELSPPSLDKMKTHFWSLIWAFRIGWRAPELK